jgi:integrase
VWVFPSTGKTGHLVEPKKAWKRILERADLSDLRIHDLRRSLGSWQAATGASLSIIGKSLGHKNINSTAIYARLNIDPVRESMETATSAMMVAGGLLPSAELIDIYANKNE